MNTPQALQEDYRARQAEALAKLDKVQQQIFRTSMLRLLLFVAGTAGLIYWRNEEWYIWACIIAVTFLPFLLLINRHTRLFARKDYLEKAVEVNRQEVKALDYDLDGMDDGCEWTDPVHDFTPDLDVFGPHSLFQTLNRTCTPMGRKLLADWLKQPLTSVQAIEERQQAVRELSALTDFRLRFRITGLLHKGDAADENELQTWAESISRFRHNRWIRLLPYTAGCINLACLLMVICGLLPGVLWALVWLAILTIGFCFTGSITKEQHIYGKKLQILGTYAKLLHQMDAQPLESPLMKHIKNRTGTGGKTASRCIRHLHKLMNALEQRNNYLVYALLNGTFLWELWQFMRIEHWKEQHAALLPQWLTSIAQTDALLSLATFAYNHPDNIFPRILPTEQTTDGLPTFRFCAQGLGHPLMHRDRCIRNDFDMPQRPMFLIITGANMAGKSTYLRTVGTNYLLACIGSTVCAHSMEVTPVHLVTSLRTTDSLAGNESYFFAELKRLQYIIQRLQRGEQLFIILDEILKGTNSTDKQKGSFALLKQLMSLQANGIIATHDLQLGQLAEQFPEHIRNYCFEADIRHDELTFSYRLRPGVAQNMNACFLMKKMGIALPE